MTQNKIESGGPRRLPIVKSKGRFYFVDERLKQFREETNPHNFIDFDSDEGQRMREEYYGRKNKD